MILTVMLIIVCSSLLLFLLHATSYYFLKNRIVKSAKWGLNICCGKTDGGGINADIFRHEELPNFVLLDSIYDLPFEDKQFDKVLCSHTLEHVEDPEAFYNELSRVGKEITLVLPPMWDVCAMLNFLEHRWIFLTLRKKHGKLPRFVKLPAAHSFQKLFFQVNHA